MKTVNVWVGVSKYTNLVTNNKQEIMFDRVLRITPKQMFWFVSFTKYVGRLDTFALTS